MNTNPVSSPRERLQRAPGGLAPWRAWVERSLERISSSLGARLQIEGARRSLVHADGTLSFEGLSIESSTPDHAWKFRKEGGTDFTLTTGTVDSMVPSNMTTTFSASPDGKFVWVKATLDEYGAVTAVILESSNTPPTPSNAWFNAEAPPTYAYYPLVKITSASGSITRIEQICSSNLTLARDTSAVGCSLNEYMVRWIENASP